MNNNGLLTFGYVFVTVLYGAYWLSLRVRLSKLQKKTGK